MEYLGEQYMDYVDYPSTGYINYKKDFFPLMSLILIVTVVPQAHLHFFFYSCSNDVHVIFL